MKTIATTDNCTFDDVLMTMTYQNVRQLEIEDQVTFTLIEIDRNDTLFCRTKNVSKDMDFVICEKSI